MELTAGYELPRAICHLINNFLIHDFHGMFPGKAIEVIVGANLHCIFLVLVNRNIDNINQFGRGY